MKVVGKTKAKSGSTPKIKVSEKLGSNELAVQKILSKAERPMSAYDIIPIMSSQVGHAVAPATVYRALKQLAAQHYVTRIESRNAYILCQHPHESHDCLFFICRTCGNATEAPDNQISRLLRREAEQIGFGINKQVMEILGLCRECAAQLSR